MLGFDLSWFTSICNENRDKAITFKHVVITRPVIECSQFLIHKELTSDSELIVYVLFMLSCSNLPVRGIAIKKHEDDNLFMTAQ